MSKFEDYFKQPVRDECGNSGWAVRGSYTREQAAVMFAEAHAVECFGEVAKTADDFLATICEGHAQFKGGYDDDGEWSNAWWWNYGAPSKNGEKRVWLAYPSGI